MVFIKKKCLAQKRKELKSYKTFLADGGGNLVLRERKVEQLETEFDAIDFYVSTAILLFVWW